MQKKGFTLIEVLVAIGIVALLSGLASISLGVARAQARNVKRKVEARVILDALRQYQADHGESLPPGVDTTSRMLGTATTGCNIACGVGDTSVTEVVLTPSADTYIYQYSSTQNFGTQQDLQTYPWNIGYNKRALVRFNLTSLPLGVTIISATLSLKESGTFGSVRTLGTYRVTRDWTETGTTWQKYTTLNPWTAAGGDFNTTPTATTSITWLPSAILDWDSWNVTNDVQQFVNGSADNYGWLLKDVNEDSSQNYWYFSSRESGNAPTLTIRYQNLAVGDGVAANCLNLKSVLVPDYMSRYPLDPSVGSEQKTYYVVKKSLGSEIYVRACGAEMGETIVTQGS